MIRQHIYNPYADAHNCCLEYACTHAQFNVPSLAGLQLLNGLITLSSPPWCSLATADALVEAFCSYLVPIDQMLIKLYTIATVVFLTVAFVKAKTIALEFFLLRAQQQAVQDAAVGGTSSRKATVGSAEDFERLLVPLDA